MATLVALYASRVPSDGPEAESIQAPPITPWWVLAGAGILTQLLTMVGGVLAARILGVEGRGQVVFVATVAAMASQLTLGGSLPNAITKQLAERGLKARDGLRGFAVKWLPIALLASLAASGYLLAVYWGDRDATIYALAAAACVTTLQLMFSRILMGAMLGEHTRPLHIAMTGILPQALVVLVFAVALASGVSWNAVELLTVTMLCTGLVLLARLRVMAPPTRRPEDRLDPKSLHALARRTHIGSVGPIDGLAIDRTLVGTLLGAAPLGLYSMAFAFGGLTTILGVAMAAVALPHMARLTRNSPEERRFAKQWLLLSAAVLGVAVLVLEIFLHPLIRFTFGDEFLSAEECARWVVLASGLLGLRRVMIALLQGRDAGRFASATELALTPVLVAGIVVAAQRDSLVAVGVTMTVTGAASCVVLGAAVFRQLRPRAGAHRGPRRSRRRSDVSTTASLRRH